MGTSPKKGCAFGTYIKQFRSSLDMTLQEFAEKLAVPFQNVSELEHGKRGPLPKRCWPILAKMGADQSLLEVYAREDLYQRWQARAKGVVL
jgi:transcriptional regulator with XRE-family HTH domain